MLHRYRNANNPTMVKILLLLNVSLLASLTAAEMSYQAMGYIEELFGLEHQQYEKRPSTDLPSINETHKEMAAYYNDLARAMNRRRTTILQNNDGRRPSAKRTFSIDIGLVTVAKVVLAKRRGMSLSREEANRLTQTAAECDSLLADYFVLD